MSSRRGAFLVGRREVREGLRRRSYRISVLIQVLVVIAIVVIATLTSGGDEKFEVAAIGAQAEEVLELAQESDDAYGVDLEVAEVADADAARAEIIDGELDAALTGSEILAGSSPSEQLTAMLQEAERSVRGSAELRRQGLSAQEVQAALEPPPLEVVAVGGDTDDDEAVAFLGMLLLYLAILFSGYGVAAALIEEKASRVIEIVLPTVRPAQILIGKIVGMGILGVIQVAAVAAAGLGAALVIGDVELPASTPSTVALILLLFAVGYAFYGTLFAAGAALVSSSDDLQSVTGPPMMVAVASYITTLQVLGDPNSPLAEFTTLFPPTAPLVVPARAAQDALPAWQLVAALALLVVATAALLAVTRRIYERGILRTGKPMKLAEALRGAR